MLSVLLSESANVDEVTKVGTAAANWLKLETGTRAIGMGGAFTSVGGGVVGWWLVVLIIRQVLLL